MNPATDQSTRVLVAGIGNIFLGDDAFGVEVVRELARRPWPERVQVLDFGIRSYDLAYALAGGCGAAILVDAMPQGQPPGTVYLLEPDLAQPGEFEGATADAHNMNPVQVLQMAKSLGGLPGRLYVVGCEPGEWEPNDGRLGLSGPVQAALPKAMELVRSLVDELLELETRTTAGVKPVQKENI